MYGALGHEKNNRKGRNKWRMDAGLNKRGRELEVKEDLVRKREREAGVKLMDIEGERKEGVELCMRREKGEAWRKERVIQGG